MWLLVVYLTRLIAGLEQYPIFWFNNGINTELWLCNSHYSPRIHSLKNDYL